MQLTSTRTLEALKPVLKDPNSSGPDPVYWVISEISSDKWMSLTIIAPGIDSGPAPRSLGEGGEFPKTFGHYHSADVPETYHLIEGEGVLQMQKKHLDENGNHVPEIVDEVYLIKAKPGDEVVITPEWGHSWSNVGKGPLLSFDDWRSGHKPTDYEPMEKLQGLAYYLMNENGEVKPVANPRYKDLPEPKWVTAQEFANRVK